MSAAVDGVGRPPAIDEFADTECPECRVGVEWRWHDYGYVVPCPGCGIPLLCEGDEVPAGDDDWAFEGWFATIDAINRFVIRGYRYGAARPTPTTGGPRWREARCRLSQFVGSEGPARR